MVELVDDARLPLVTKVQDVKRITLIKINASQFYLPFTYDSVLFDGETRLPRFRIGSKRRVCDRPQWPLGAQHRTLSNSL
ncbi:Heat shock protein [Musa troglodytarum]|uniref:Heat shock protein n=1 Tax=Musa troglodytarum TaxID=320322 RepID=A0A9E7HK40_9LILI|nr:Heat shock protein [Musa troglodytarum]